MAVTFATLFERLGKLMYLGEYVRLEQAALKSIYDDVMTKFRDSGADLSANTTRNIQARVTEWGNIVSDAQTDSIRTLIEMMDDDTTVDKFDVQASIRELIRQMIAGSKIVKRPTAGYVTVPTGGKGTGGSLNFAGASNGLMLVSDMMPLQGFTATVSLFEDWPSIQTETFRARCLLDNTERSITAGEEFFEIQGQRSVPRLDYEWPKGSGAKGGYSVATPNRNGGRGAGQNVCTNTNFETFTTANSPDNWTITDGSVGTDILAAGAGFTGSNALKFVGDGSSAPVEIRQALNTVGATRGQINPDRPYSISVAAKYATATPTGSLVISIKKSDGTILNNGNTGREMSLTVASGDFTTSYALYSATCFSPIAVPEGSYICIEMTGTFANTSEIFIDDVVIAEMAPIQRGGAAFQMIGGATPFARGDEFTLTVTNNISASNGGEFAKEFERYYSIGNQYGLALPSTTGTADPLDSLIGGT